MIISLSLILACCLWLTAGSKGITRSDSNSLFYVLHLQRVYFGQNCLLQSVFYGESLHPSRSNCSRAIIIHCGSALKQTFGLLFLRLDLWATISPIIPPLWGQIGLLYCFEKIFWARFVVPQPLMIHYSVARKKSAWDAFQKAQTHLGGSKLLLRTKFTESNTRDPGLKLCFSL